MAACGQQSQKYVNIYFYGFNKAKTVSERMLQAYTGFVHCGINFGGGEDVSAWTGRTTGACVLCSDVPMFERCQQHFLRLRECFAFAVSDNTVLALLHHLQQRPEQWRREPHIVMPCFGIRYPSMREIVLDLLRSFVGAQTEAVGSNEKLQCAQFSLMTLMFLMEREKLCEHPPPVLSQLANRGCSLTPDALFHALSDLCSKYPQIHHTRLACEDSGSNWYLDRPQDMVPMSIVTH